MPNQEWLTITEACRILKLARRTLYTYMESGHLPFYQLGGTGHRRIKAEDLDALMVSGGSRRGLLTEGHAEEPAKIPVPQESLAPMAIPGQGPQDTHDHIEELERLLPLKVWSGHPCALCGEPLKGIVDHELARVLLKHAAHKRCIDERANRRSFPLIFTFLEDQFVSAE